MKLTHLTLLLLCGILYSKNGSTTDQPCPNDMVSTGVGSCLDRFEWPNKRGVKPLIAVSGIAETNDKTFVAEDLCASVGKRICTRKEWRSACKGPENYKYSYGDKYNSEACNTDKLWKPVNTTKIANRNKAHISYLDQSEPSGNRESCVSQVGAYDMVGNAEEWVKCDNGKFGWCLVGGYWADSRSSCDYSITKHAPNWHYYQGFRCCKNELN